MQGKGSPGVIVEVDRHAPEAVRHDGVVAVDDLLRGHPFPVGPDGDGNPVLVRAADEQHVRPLLPLVAHVDIGRDVGSGKMPQVQGAVGVG